MSRHAAKSKDRASLQRIGRQAKLSMSIVESRGQLLDRTLDTNFSIQTPAPGTKNAKTQARDGAHFAGTSPGGLDGPITRRMADSISAPATLVKVFVKSGEALIPVVLKVGFLSIRRDMTKDRIEALGIPEIVKSMKFGEAA